MDYADWVVQYNERLEFLGDAVLGAVVSWLLFTNFPDLPESHLTLSKIFLIKEHTLAIVARSLWIGAVMRLGTWEHRSGWRNKDSVLSDGLEAFIAFVYLQYWRSTVEKFIETHIYTLLADQPVAPTKSPKNMLQELVQKYHNQLPVYEMKELEYSTSWDVTIFGANVYVLGQFVCQWTWSSKKKAQEDWAKKALNLLQVDDTWIVLTPV